jgi:hypothetical protein
MRARREKSPNGGLAPYKQQEFELSFTGEQGMDNFQ